MKCKRCKQEGSPIHETLKRLDALESVTVLSACAGYTYEGHTSLPERPFLLFTVHSWRTLENLWQRVFSKLAVPTSLIYNGAKQFLFEVELPLGWPERTKVLESIWEAVGNRMESFDE